MAPQTALRDASDDIDRLTDYARTIADQVGLRDYVVEGVIVSELPRGVRATCTCVTGRRYVRLQVAQEFFALSGEEQREAVVHEMVHPHLHPLAEHIDGLREELGRAHHATLASGFTRDLERAADSITGLLVPHLPLPPWSRS